MADFIEIVLVEPEIPPNTGTIGRLCVALDIRLHLVKPLGFSLEDKYLKRAGLDYWQHLDLKIWDSYEAFRKENGTRRKWFFTKKAPRTYFEAEFRSGDMLIFGKETAGLSDEILKDGNDYLLKLPMPGKTRSINLSNAVTAGAYEAYRQISR